MDIVGFQRLSHRCPPVRGDYQRPKTPSRPLVWPSLIDSSIYIEVKTLSFRKTFSQRFVEPTNPDAVVFLRGRESSKRPG